MRGRDKFKKYKFLINSLVKFSYILPYQLRLKLFRSFRMLQGLKGLLIRYVLLKTIAKKCGDNVSIHPNAYIFNPQNLSVGDNVSIHPLCYIESLGEVEIGNDVSIAHGVTIMSTNHNYNQLEVPINNQGITKEKVIIKNNVWIGAKATILAGVIISSGSIIGAGVLVNKNVQENHIVGGIPAKLIKIRK